MFNNLLSSFINEDAINKAINKMTNGQIVSVDNIKTILDEVVTQPIIEQLKNNTINMHLNAMQIDETYRECVESIIREEMREYLKNTNLKDGLGDK